MLIATNIAAYPKHSDRHQKSNYHQQGFKPINLKKAMKHFSRLDITDEQREQIRALVKAEIEANKPKRKQLKELHLKIRELKSNDVLDEKAIKKTAREIADIRADMMISKSKGMREIESLLTEEQKQKLTERRYGITLFNQYNSKSCFY